MYFKIEQRICGGKRPAAAEDTFNQWFLISRIIMRFCPLFVNRKRPRRMLDRRGPVVLSVRIIGSG